MLHETRTRLHRATTCHVSLADGNELNTRGSAVVGVPVNPPPKSALPAGHVAVAVTTLPFVDVCAVPVTI
jgi:hypothetical protein